MYARTGRITAGVGSVNPLRSDTAGALAVIQGGKYREAAIRGRMFFSYCAARATSVPATAQIGNIIYNPPTSGVYLAMAKWNAQIQVTSATTLGLTFGVSAQLTTPTTTTAADSTGSCLLAPPGFTQGKALAMPSQQS